MRTLIAFPLIFLSACAASHSAAPMSQPQRPDSPAQVKPIPEPPEMELRDITEPVPVDTGTR